MHPVSRATRPTRWARRCEAFVSGAVTVAQVAKGTPAAQVEIGGYTVLQAESLDAAKAILAKHPFVGCGGTLKLSEVLVV